MKVRDSAFRTDFRHGSDRQLALKAKDQAREDRLAELQTSLEKTSTRGTYAGFKP